MLCMSATEIVQTCVERFMANAEGGGGKFESARYKNKIY